MKTIKILSVKSSRIILVLIFLLGIVFYSCNKDDNESNPAPKLPPETSFVMDFTDFTDIDTTAMYKSSQSHHHWGLAVTNVVVWNAVLTITFVVPVAAFYESFNHGGIWDPEISAWVWSYNFIAGGVVHLAELQGSLVDEGVKWEMYISKNEAYSNFLWYWGISNSENTAGEWHLNGNPEDQEELILIEWNKNPEIGEADIKYTNVKEGAQEEGGYIFYGVNQDEIYNAFYDIYSANYDNLINIQWHRSNKNGRIRDEHHFGDFEWRCWDESLLDTECE